MDKIINEKKENEEKKNEEELIEIDNASINDLLKDSLLFLNKDSISKASKAYYPNIYESLKNYLNDIDEFILGKEKIGNFPVKKADEYDIYRAYGFLCGIRIIVKGDLEIISKFNYKELRNFEKFLNIYGNSRNITKNYDSNFQEHKKGKKDLDLTLINKWINKLDEKKLCPLKKNKKRKKKNKANNSKDTKDTLENNNLKESEIKDDYTADNKNKINEGKKIDDNLGKKASKIQISKKDITKASSLKDSDTISSVVLEGPHNAGGVNGTLPISIGIVRTVLDGIAVNGRETVPAGLAHHIAVGCIVGIASLTTAC